MNHQPPVISASGTHREVGRQIGEAARDLVAQGLAAYEERFPALAGFSFAEAVERSRAYLLPAEDHLPRPSTSSAGSRRAQTRRSTVSSP